MAEPQDIVEGADKRLQLPNHALFVGASMSGKTRAALHLFIKAKQLFNPPPARIILLYDQIQPMYLAAKEAVEKEGIQFVLRRGNTANLDALEPAPNGGQTILLIDDASEETSASPEIARIATNGRHKGISLFLIWHNLFHRHAPSRVIVANTGYCFFMPSIRLSSELRTFGTQIGMHPLLLNAYKMVVESPTTAAGDHTAAGDTESQCPLCPHNYLFLDITAAAHPSLRLRSHIHCPSHQYCYLFK